MTLLEELKGQLGTGVAVAVGDTQLEQIIATIEAKHGAEDREKLLDLAQAAVCVRMATDSALYFKYSQGSESVDKTKTTDNFLAVAKALWVKHGVEGGSGGEGLMTVGRSRRTQE